MGEDEKILQKKIVYDFFIDENPDIQERVERGITLGEIRSLQRLAITAIKRRFPALLDQAQTQIEQIQNTDTLDELILQLASVTTEREVRQILQIQEKQ